MTFTVTEDFDNADLRIGFFVGDHGDDVAAVPALDGRVPIPNSIPITPTAAPSAASSLSLSLPLLDDLALPLSPSATLAPACSQGLRAMLPLALLPLELVLAGLVAAQTSVRFFLFCFFVRRV